MPTGTNNSFAAFLALLWSLVAPCMGGGPTDPPPPVDGDGDGVVAQDDCDDADAAVFPGAPEVCNAIDDNCDGLVDIEDPAVIDSDVDGDGFVASACGGVDCDDGDAHVFPDATYTSGWQRECLPAVAPGAEGSWARARVNLPTFFEDPQTGGQYLYFRGNHDPTFHQIGFATRTSSGEQWSALQGPILSEDPTPGAWDGRKVSHPSVAYVPGKVQGYVMAYHALDDDSSARRVGIATANLASGQDSDGDGVADAPFQREDLGGAALAGAILDVSASATAGDNERVLNPALWYDDTEQRLHVWYTGRYGSPNEFVIMHASCDVVVTDCGAGDWVKTDADEDGDPDIYLEGTDGGWDDDNTQQAFVMEHSAPGGLFGYELEVWYTGGSESIGYLQGDIADADSWSSYPGNPVFEATTALGRFDSESVTGRGVYWDGTDYQMFYGTSVALPEDPTTGEVQDPLWGAGNYSGGASYIGHATNRAPSLGAMALSCAAVSGEVIDHGPDTVALEVWADGAVIAGPVYGNAPASGGFEVQDSAFTIALGFGAGGHGITVLATDAAGAQRSWSGEVLCP